MNTSSLSKSQNILIPMVLFHLVVIAASNYLVQIPIEIFGLHTTWGAFTFPLIFLATDLTVRIFGAPQARRIIFMTMLPALVISYILSVLFYEAKFQGFEQLTTLNTFVARIAVASFIAYTIGQLLDVTIFNKLRDKKHWWVAPAASSIIGGLIDSILFFGIAFYNSTDEFMATNWPEIATVDYAFKLIISIALFVPAYGALMSSLSKRLK